MNIGESLLPEFDQEMANTRKTIERTSDEKFGWKPHDKSWTMGQLVSHLVNIQIWALHTLNKDNFDMAPQGESLRKTGQMAGKKEALQTLFRKQLLWPIDPRKRFWISSTRLCTHVPLHLFRAVL